MSARPNSFRLNHENKRCLGVCAGIADYLDVPAALIRVIFVICVLFWPTLIVFYFIIYFCLDRGITTQSMQGAFKKSSTAEHFRKLNYRRPIYKNRSNKRIAGVCSGIADYLDISPFVVRILTLGSLFIAGPFVVLAYIVCMFAFDPDPSAPLSNRQMRRQRRREKRHAGRSGKFQRRQRKNNSYVNDEYMASNKQASNQHRDSEAFEDSRNEDSAHTTSNSTEHYDAEQCTEIYQTLESRLREIEAYITSKRFRLHCEINRI
ncbi:MAG: hypothetical protein COC19_05925 [SAR86 cluster bacterium]|uniref:Phage shock protein PspC N-terminal domain-containing protein n=1 Tax=SAR86 cluster bacterium TaxID=2030880 RepID=A0A2A4MKN7_9GAMM|nr:MAG: hypothetical protein COC19_05925 [SAR86 cluster bacterium]